MERAIMVREMSGFIHMLLTCAVCSASIYLKSETTNWEITRFVYCFTSYGNAKKSYECKLAWILEYRNCHIAPYTHDHYRLSSYKYHIHPIFFKTFLLGNWVKHCTHTYDIYVTCVHTLHSLAFTLLWILAIVSGVLCNNFLVFHKCKFF